MSDTPERKQDEPAQGNEAEAEVDRGKAVVLLIALLGIVTVLAYGLVRLLSDNAATTLMLAVQVVTLLFVIAIYEKT